MNKLLRFLNMSRDEKKISICRNTYRIFNRRRFEKIGVRSYIYKPIHLAGTKYISMGHDSGIWHNARIEVIDDWNGRKLSPKLTIGNDVHIGQDLHLTCADRIDIEDGVLCSSRVTILDNSHIAKDVSIPVLEQDIVTKPVRICEGAFIGINAVILPGVTVGKHAIVGANSVVTKDVSDYVTVVGAPAKEIRNNKV